MKNLIFLYISAALLLSAVVSCKKDIRVEPTTSFTIVNALTGGKELIANFSGQYDMKWYRTALRIKYRTYEPINHLTIPVKEQPLAIYNFPDTTAQDKPVYQLALKPLGGEATTLFLFGTLAQPESLFVTKMPPHYSDADSLMGLRFINLSPDKAPVRIRISGSGIDSPVGNLAYKATTDYIPVKATKSVGDVLIEFYDQVSGGLLSSYTIKNVGAVNVNPPVLPNPWRYRNYTMVWLPKDINGNLAADSFLINDY